MIEDVVIIGSSFMSHNKKLNHLENHNQHGLIYEIPSHNMPSLIMTV